MAKTSVLTILFQLAKKGNADQETIQGLAKVKSAAQTAGMVFAGMAAVGYTLNTVYKNTAQVFLDNATKVRDLARSSRMSAEESSRMIEAADDLGVSYEVLRKSLWNANKNGFQITIDTVSQMADEFVAIQDPTERADYLIKRFGKSGEEMGKILEKGGANFKKFADSVSDGQIFSDDDLRNAREYEMQLDAFNDQWNALKMSAGRPIIAKLLLIFENTNDLDLIRNELDLTGNAARNMDRALSRMHKEIDSGNLDTATEGYMKMAQAAEYDAQMQGMNSDEMQRAQAEAESLAAKQGQVLDVAFRLQDAFNSYNEKMSEIDNTQREAQAAYDEAVASYEKGLITQAELNDATAEYNQTMSETGAAAEKAAAQHQDAMNRIVFSIIQAQLAADGLTAEESKGLLQISVQLGLVDQATADMAQGIVDSFSASGDAIRTDGIGPAYKFNEQLYIAKGYQGNYRYNFLITTSGSVPNFSALGKGARDAAIDQSGAGGSGLGGGAFASGGQMGNGWSLVGERGYEFVSPSGYVFTHEQSVALEQAGIIPKNAFELGGQGIGGLKAAAAQFQAKHRTGSSSISTTGATSVAETAQQVAEVSTQATQATVQSNQDLAGVTTEMIRTTQQTSESLIGEVVKLNDNITTLQDVTVRSIREELQKVI